MTAMVTIGGEEFYRADFASALDLCDAWRARDLTAALRAGAFARSRDGLLAALTFIAAESPAGENWTALLRTQLLER